MEVTTKKIVFADLVKEIEQKWRDKYPIGDGVREHHMSRKERINMEANNDEHSPQWSNETNAIGIEDYQDEEHSSTFRKGIAWDPKTGLLKLSHWEGEVD